MKVIKIEIHNLPPGFNRPEVEIVNYPKISAKIMDELDTVDYDDTNEVTKDVYPLEHLALGKYLESFYIREKDKKAFEEMIKGFVNKAERDLLQKIVDHGMKKPDRAWGLVQELYKEKNK